MGGEQDPRSTKGKRAHPDGLVAGLALRRLLQRYELRDQHTSRISQGTTVTASQGSSEHSLPSNRPT